jgi:hypothetical protein
VAWVNGPTVCWVYRWCNSSQEVGVSCISCGPGPVPWALLETKKEIWQAPTVSGWRGRAGMEPCMATAVPQYPAKQQVSSKCLLNEYQCGLEAGMVHIASNKQQTGYSQE